MDIARLQVQQQSRGHGGQVEKMVGRRSSGATLRNFGDPSSSDKCSVFDRCKCIFYKEACTHGTKFGGSM